MLAGMSVLQTIITDVLASVLAGVALAVLNQLWTRRSLGLGIATKRATFVLMQQAKYVLRDLPGVRALEERYRKISAHPHPDWAPEADGRPAHLDKVLSCLFGLTADEAEEALWEYGRAGNLLDGTLGDLLDMSDATDEFEVGLWRSIGWDVTDEAGEILHCLDDLVFSIVCATKAIAGRLPDATPSDEELEARAVSWADSLANEAARFKRRRRG